MSCSSTEIGLGVLSSHDGSSVEEPAMVSRDIGGGKRQAVLPMPAMHLAGLPIALAEHVMPLIAVVSISWSSLILVADAQHLGTPYHAGGSAAVPTVETRA